MRKLKVKELKPKAKVLTKADLKHLKGVIGGAHQDDASVNISQDTGCDLCVCACRCNLL